MKKNKSLPNFIGIGVMKSATTWISQCLREHPQIFMSEIKEIHFFSHKYENGLDWYLQHFQKAENHTAIGEFSVSYFDNSLYIDRINSDLGNIKILINLRDPISRFISHLKHLYRVENIDKDLLKNRIDMEFFDYITQKFPSLLQKGLYFDMIMACEKKFSSKNIMITTKEDIDENPKAVLSSIYKFLNVDSNFEPKKLRQNVSIGIIPKYIFLEKFRVKIYRISKRYFPRIILFFRKHRLGEIYRYLNNNKTEIILDRDVYLKLKEFYSNDVQSIQEYMNINTSNWLSNEK